MNINRFTSHPSAFISSTFLDLKKERRAVADTLTSAGINVNALDVKPASNDSSKQEIIKGIKESDFIIAIVGERYGTIDRKITGWPRFSITRWEYVIARRNKKYALVFFKNVRSSDPIYYDDIDFEIKKKYLREFKKQLSETHNPKYFETAKELAVEIKTALIPIYRNGVSNLLSKVETLEKEIESLKRENQKLKDIGSETTKQIENALLEHRPTRNALLGLGKEPPRTGLLSGAGYLDYLKDRS